MTDKPDYSLRPVHVDDLPELLAWRNHPDICKYMLTQHEISPSEHRDWFQRVTMDHHRRLLMIERHGQAMGYVQFSGITGEFADWGFYVAPGSPKGSGRGLAMVALSHAFGPMALTQVRGKALSFNHASIKLHLSCGFRQEPNRELTKCDVGRTDDLLCFVLERSTWRKLEAKNA
jgi:UDP-4-amino-4,6-dideoxy-N-acetyl-beta-L-altrosamine N-acetyltransferase